eukprot:gene34307-44313_t
MSVEGASVGIDLGTTYSCVGVWQNDRVEIIANDQGNRTTPSYVAFNDTERLIGDAAKNQVAMNASNTVFDAKRLIGRKFEDSAVQSDMKHWPFKVISGPGGKPIIQVTFKGETKQFASEEISSMVSESDKKKVLDAVNSTTQWLDSNQSAEKEEFEEKQKALEAIVLPILQNLSGGAGGAPGGFPGGFPGAGGFPGGPTASGPAEASDEGPKIEEID